MYLYCCYFSALEVVYNQLHTECRKTGSVQEACVRRLAVWSITLLMVKIFSPHGLGARLSPFFVCCLRADWWKHRVTVPAPPRSSTAQEMVTCRKDVDAWWEAMIECASNTYQSSLRELHFIDRLPPLGPNPPPSAVSTLPMAQTYFTRLLQWKFLLIWSLLLVSISVKKGTAGKLLIPVQQVFHVCVCVCGCVLVGAQVCWRTCFICIYHVVRLTGCCLLSFTPFLFKLPLNI